MRYETHPVFPLPIVYVQTRSGKETARREKHATEGQPLQTIWAEVQRRLAAN